MNRSSPQRRDSVVVIIGSLVAKLLAGCVGKPAPRQIPVVIRPAAQRPTRQR
ncbi:MAG: hypothetical protein SGJ11_03955 [Phycisphaerae bacterium]|nr:hypothetical protein [Phycisphaerae bacterium]